MMFQTNRTVFTLAASAALFGCATGSMDPAGAAGGGGTGGGMTDPVAAGGVAPMPSATGGAAPTAAGGMAPTATGGMAPAATGGAAPTPTVDGVAAPSGGVDPTGVWWTEVETIGTQQLPWLGTLTNSDIRFVMRVEVAGTAPENKVTLEFCELQTEWIDPADPNNITTIGFRPETVASFSETIEADFGGLLPGSEIPLPSFAFLGGIDESGEDFDEDGDGNPAVTAWVKTLLGLQIEVYETITITAALDLVAADENTLEGTLDFNADAMIISSNNPIIPSDFPVTITPDSTEVPIVIERLSGSPGCSELPSTITFTEVPPPPPAAPPPAPAPAPAPAPMP